MIAELIIQCQSERIVTQLCEVFVSTASFRQQASSTDRRAYFQRKFARIVFDFARYVHICRYGGSCRLFRLFLEDPTESSIIFAFEDFVSIPSREQFEKMIIRVTEKASNGTEKEGQMRAES